MISVRGGDIDLNPDEWIEAIHSPWTRRFGHRPLGGPGRGAACSQRESIPGATALSDGGRVGDIGRNAAIRGHAFDLAVIGFRDAIASQRQKLLTQAPPPQSRPQPQQETQRRPTPPRETNEAPASRPPAPEATQAKLVRAEKTEPEKQKQSSEAQPVASQPAEQTPEQPNLAEAVAQYVALGGPLGGGFAAPPVDTNVPGDDWTAAFRERVGACSKQPEGVEPSDKVIIKIRVSFNRDGTVASPPRLLVPAPSAKQQAMMESAADALERCQPFTMLPPEKYKQWKTMVFYVTPLFSPW